MPYSSLVKGWDHSIETYLEYHEKQKLLKLVTHMWNFCNLGCPGCFVNKVSDPKDISGDAFKRKYQDEMFLDKRIELLKEAQSLGVKTVDYVGAGEPTLDPYFDVLVDTANTLGIHVVVFTHGATDVLLKKENLQKYIDKNISFFIKLWSFDPDKEKTLVRGRIKDYSLKRNQALNNLKDLGFMNGEIIEIDGIQRKTTRVAADILVTKSNYHEIPDIFRYCRYNNIMPEIKTYIPEGPTRMDQLNEFVQLSHEEKEQLKKNEVNQKDFFILRKQIEAIDEKEFGIKKMPYFYPQGHFCTQSMAALYVDIRSNIYACVGTHHIYEKYTVGQNILQKVLCSRIERVGLGCIPRLEDSKNRNILLPKEEKDILSLYSKEQE